MINHSKSSSNQMFTTVLRQDAAFCYHCDPWDLSAEPPRQNPRRCRKSIMRYRSLPDRYSERFLDPMSPILELQDPEKSQYCFLPANDKAEIVTTWPDLIEATIAEPCASGLEASLRTCAMEEWNPLELMMPEGRPEMASFPIFYATIVSANCKLCRVRIWWTRSSWRRGIIEIRNNGRFADT